MEVEIKLQVPASERRGLSASLHAQSAQAERLQARYYDTSDRALARAGIALRLRKEGGQWVQTLKTAAHGGALVRTEHNVPLPAAKRAPALKIEHHRGSAGWKVLRRALRDAQGPLLERYMTDIRRLSARACEGEAVIEYALDTGVISAPTPAESTAKDGILSVSELEIELVSGSPEDLFIAARRLLEQRSLWIDVRSKALRGESVAAGDLLTAPAGAVALTLGRRASMQQLAQQALSGCVRQLALNLSQIAASDGYLDAHVHQARVALRRLRTATALLPQAFPHRRAWDAAARQLSRQLGCSRDAAVMASMLWPALQQARAPLVALPVPPSDAMPADIVRARPVQLWLLELLAATLVEPEPQEDTERWTAVLPTLRRWHAQCRSGARRFGSMTEEQRHRLRKQLKRLRYGSEFVAAACSASKQRVFANRIGKALDALGAYNDMHTALLCYRDAAVQKPEAWFAAGWLAAHLPSATQRCERALHKFVRADAPWALA